MFRSRRFGAVTHCARVVHVDSWMLRDVLLRHLVLVCTSGVCGEIAGWMVGGVYAYLVSGLGVAGRVSG
jgi:hypothetical protein